MMEGDAIIRDLIDLIHKFRGEADIGLTEEVVLNLLVGDKVFEALDRDRTWIMEQVKAVSLEAAKAEPFGPAAGTLFLGEVAGEPVTVQILPNNLDVIYHVLKSAGKDPLARFIALNDEVNDIWQKDDLYHAVCEKRFARLYRRIQSARIVYKSFVDSELEAAYSSADAKKILDRLEVLPADPLLASLKFLGMWDAGLIDKYGYHVLADSERDKLHLSIGKARLARIDSFEGLSVSRLFQSARVLPSGKEFKRMVKNGGVRVNSKVLTDETAIIEAVTFNGRAELSVGKKSTYVLAVQKGSREDSQLRKYTHDYDPPVTELPSVTLSLSEVGSNVPAFKLFYLAGLSPSLRQGKRLIQENGARIDGVLVTDINEPVDLTKVKEGEPLKLSAGKKRHKLLYVDPG